MRNLSEHIGFHDPNEMFDSIMINAAVCMNICIFHVYTHQFGNLHTDVIIQALSSVRICGNLNLNMNNEDTAILQSIKLHTILCLVMVKPYKNMHTLYSVL